MTTDTNVLSYWNNWRFLICAIFILSSIVLAAVLIWKYEGCKKSRRERRENQRETVGSLYEDEAWRTSLKLGSSLSIYGCYKYRSRVGEDAADHVRDEERGTYVAPTLGENADTSNTYKSFTDEECPSRKGAGVYVYIFQVIYQMCGGAVVLTDVIFWLILYPFLTSKDYKLNFMMVSMHSFNVVFLLGETILNSLRFPLFRISYFVLWTGIFVIFQWIIHACKNMWWPYPFLDLSSSYAPLWYLGVGVAHIPCYGAYALIIRMKQLWFSRSFPGSFQVER
ncbi:uncharacterized protein LOC112167884 isoform X2 [Rosa chinensis]|uniref:uncharacterized protein LOC112167884 isoform X2 n=1 Tax=Rosa chinensis TaxID=74649 RepID=UPI001AD8A2D5|nr:uncharacterized protein LOC112167884 isoform X2 [Rosa chinensis]